MAKVRKAESAERRYTKAITTNFSDQIIMCYVITLLIMNSNDNAYHRKFVRQKKNAEYSNKPFLYLEIYPELS